MTAPRAFAGLDQQGLLQKGFEPQVSWDALGQQPLPADKSYTPTGVTLVAAVVYDSTKVTTPPASFSELPQPKWKGLAGMNDPSQSGPSTVHRRHDEQAGSADRGVRAAARRPRGLGRAAPGHGRLPCLRRPGDGELAGIQAGG
ncbi:MAG TPA: ABC transporter substrate-binding protein [Streptosporangiaceae bacterium]